MRYFGWRWPEGGSPSVLIDARTREDAGRLLPEVLLGSEDWAPYGISSDHEIEADPSLAAALIVYLDAEVEWLMMETSVLRDELG